MNLQRNMMITILHGIVEYLLLFPVVFIIGFLMLGEPEIWMWLGCLLFLFLLGIVFKSFVDHLKWWMYPLVSIVLGIFASILFTEQWLIFIVLSLIQIVFVYRGMMYASHDFLTSLIPTSFMWIGGLGIYFVGYFVYRYVDRLLPYLPVLTLLGLITIITIFFLTNSEQLKAATFSKQKHPFISRAIKAQNRVHLIITLAFIALIAFGETIRSWIWQGIRTVLQWLFQGLSDSEQAPIIEETPPPASFDFGELERGEPSAFAKFLEMITMYIFYAFLIVAVIVCVLLLIKKTRKWLFQITKSVLAFLKRLAQRTFHQEEAMQYVDEKESIFKWEEWKKEHQEKALDMIKKVFTREPNWEKLSNEEKVRYVYKKLIQKNRNVYRAATTPRELIKDLQSTTKDERLLEQLIELYERVRYGEKEIEDDVLNELRILIKD